MEGFQWRFSRQPDGWVDEIWNECKWPSRGSANAGSGGSPPWMMAVLGLLAYKAMKGGALGNLLGANERGTPSQLPPTGSGGIGDIVGQILGGGQRRPADMNSSGGGGLGGLLGGLQTGGAAGTLLNGGLRNLVGDMKQNGHGDIAESWVGTGPNQQLPPNDLARAIGLDGRSASIGLECRVRIASELSDRLPNS